MKHIPIRTAAMLALSAALALSACSSPQSGGPEGGDQKVPAARGDGKTLTVWVMDGDYTPETLDAINTAFTKRTGAKVDVQIQAWDGITTKITTALATSTPPDVLDLGNTQVASFAATGGLMDLTPYADDLSQGQTWLDGLEAPATVDGRLYAVPGFAGARAVIYHKKLWAKAGVTAPPTSYDELTQALSKVQSANRAPDFSAFYFPGQNWYGGMQFVWDAGGDIATKKGATWSMGMSSPEAQQGLAAYKDFQNRFSSKASRTTDVATPDQTQVFADGKAGAILATAGFIGKILESNPQLTEADLGTFPFPGRSGKSQPVMLGGSDWGIAAKSANSALALQWVKIAASPDVQSEWVVGKEGFIPNSIEGIEAAVKTVSPIKKAFYDAALNSKATPASANWAQVEGTKDINTLFQAIASGTKTPADAAKAFDTSAARTLNATS